MFTSIELFAGCGGLALGLHQAGFHHILVNEIDKTACETMKRNMPDWNVVKEDIKNIDFSVYKGKIDLLSGGFPCQSFSLAGKRLGFEDIRGTLFYEMARAIKECEPKMFLCENVKGLLYNDKGKTFETICNILEDLGYTILCKDVFNCMFHNVPQKRERLIIIGIRNDLYNNQTFELEKQEPLTLRDALYAGKLYPTDCPDSVGSEYNETKKRVFSMIPEGGNWRNLPLEIQKEYMGANFYSKGGGQANLARKLEMDKPCLTLLCSPQQKQTERCHPYEIRPLRTREYARIQTFPDDYSFAGGVTSIYKQIGNAVPVNFAKALGEKLIEILKTI